MLICVVATGTGDASNAARQVFIDLASADAVGTHHLESDPARADALLFVDAHCNTADVLQRQLRRHPLVRAHRGKTYVYDQRDRPLWSFPGLYMSATRREAQRRRLMIGGPYATADAVDELPDRSPDLLFSFRGSRTHPLRDEVLRLRHPRALVEDTTEAGFFGPATSELLARQRVERGRYRESMARSKFVLCPRGYGVSSVRLYEVLRAGRVPVILSDEWLRPRGVDWDAGCVTVAERDVAQIPELLERLEPDWETMRSASGTLAENFARDHLWHYYANSIAGLAAERGRVVRPWWAQRRVARYWVDRTAVALGRSRADYV